MNRWLVFGLVLTLLHGGDARACSCARDRSPVPQQVARAYQSASFVAEIEVVSRSREQRPYPETITPDFTVMEINILRLWKGSPDVKSIATGLGGGDCGLPFEAGQKVLVYGAVSETSGRVSIGACSRTRLLKDAAEDVALLEDIKETT